MNIFISTIALLIIEVQLIRLTVDQLPKYRDPCTPGDPNYATKCTPKRRAGLFDIGKESKGNNVFCKIYGICVHYMFNTFALSTYQGWRAQSAEVRKHVFPRQKIHDVIKHWYNHNKSWRPYHTARKEGEADDSLAVPAASSSTERKEE